MKTHNLASAARVILVSIFLGLLFAGSASAQNVSLSSGKLTFSNQVNGTTSAIKTVTLTNTDTETALTLASITASGDFIPTNTCGTSVPAGGKCTISVQFAPKTTGTIDGSVSIVDDAPGSPQLIDLAGTGIAQASVSPSSLSFGTVPIGSTSAVKPVKLTNNTGFTITLTSIAASGDYTAVAATTGGCGATLAASASCTENVTFTPTSLGNMNGSVTFKDSATGSPQFVTLFGTGSGTANSPITLTPPSLAFGNLAVGGISIVKPVTIKNKGLSNLAITIIPSAGYSESSPPTVGCGTSLAGGASCTINVQFAPTVLGPIDGGIKVGYVGANSPQVVSLTGNGIGQVTVFPASLTFSAQAAGTISPTKNVTVTNNTGATINVSSIAKSGDFTETNTCGGGIGAGKSCTVSVGFAPAGAGSFLGSIVITDGATNSPQIVDLSGSSPMVPRFAYAANLDGTISSFTVDFTTGQLRHTGYITAGSSTQSVVATPSGAFVYAANFGSGDVSAYSANAKTGTLTEVSGSPFGAGAFSFAITVDPSGKFVYVANANSASNNISGYTINSTTGVLTPMSGSPFAAGNDTRAVVVAANGKFLYAANASSNNVSAYTINAATGVLTQIANSPFPLPPGNFVPQSIAVDPATKFAFVGSTDSTNVFAFTINPTTGALATVAGSPFANPGGSNYGITVDPSDRFVYVANDSSNSVSAYSINGSTGALIPLAGSPFAGGKGAFSVAVDPSDRFLFVADQRSGDVLVFSIDSSSGKPTLNRTIRGRLFPNSIALANGATPITYTPKFAYAANNGSNNVSAYAIDDDTGVLAAITGSPFNAGMAPRCVTTDPSGKFAYVASNDISAYTINAITGFLTPVSSSPFAAGTTPFSMAVDPSGRFAYVANQGSMNISAYTIIASTGGLRQITGSPYPTGAFSAPDWVAVDPTGRFVYVANSFLNGTPGNILAYAIDSGTGALTPITGSPFTAGAFYPSSVAVDPTGKFAYLTNSVGRSVMSYDIDATTGALALVGSPLMEGHVPVAVTVNPSDRVIYVADVDANILQFYTYDATTGALNLLARRGIGAIAAPFSVAVDASAKFVYAATNGTNNINAYTIDQITGDLTGITGAPYPAGMGPISVTTTAEIH